MNTLIKCLISFLLLSLVAGCAVVPSYGGRYGNYRHYSGGRAVAGIAAGAVIGNLPVAEAVRRIRGGDEGDLLPREIDTAGGRGDGAGDVVGGVRVGDNGDVVAVIGDQGVGAAGRDDGLQLCGRGFKQPLIRTNKRPMIGQLK